MNKTPINTLLKWLAVADMFVMIEYIPFTIYMYIFPGKLIDLLLTGVFINTYYLFALIHRMIYNVVIHPVRAANRMCFFFVSILSNRSKKKKINKKMHVKIDSNAALSDEKNVIKSHTKCSYFAFRKSNARYIFVFIVTFIFLGRMDFKYPWAVYLLFHMHFTQILHTISISLTVILALWRYIAIK